MGFKLTVIGLTLSSSWGNGHATTYRALLRALADRGASITFLERDVPWYRDNRDLSDPDFAELKLYESVEDLKTRHSREVRDADAVVVGSYVPDGVPVIDWVREMARGPVAFYDIDTPATLARLERGEEEYLAKRQIPQFDAYLTFAGGTIPTILRTRYGARRALPLYCTVDAALYRPLPDRPKTWRLGYLGTYSEDRQPAIKRLLIEPAYQRPRDQFVVAGAQYPSGIVWPGNVARTAHLPPREHAEFYNAQRFTLNVTRADMIAAGWSPSVRLFEAAACGTPIISDRWNGLDNLFPEAEAVLVADTTEDVLAYLDLPEVRRRRIAEAARDIVMENHRAEARAVELEAVLHDAQRRVGETAA